MEGKNPGKKFIKAADNDIESRGGKVVDDATLQKLREEMRRPEIAMQTGLGSVRRIILEHLMKEYPNLGIEIAQKSQTGAMYYRTNSQQHLRIINRVFQDGAVLAFLMERPYESKAIGKELEDSGRIPKGITEKSYVRYLKEHLRKYENVGAQPSAIRAELMREKKELEELESKGIEPLSDEEISKAVKVIIYRIMSADPGLER